MGLLIKKKCVLLDCLFLISYSFRLFSSVIGGFLSDKLRKRKPLVIGAGMVHYFNFTYDKFRCEMISTCMYKVENLLEIIRILKKVH